MILSPVERLVCRVAALRDEPPLYEVVVIPGDSAPEWRACSSYTIEGIDGESIDTEIYITVGCEYMETLRARVTASMREKAI